MSRNGTGVFAVLNPILVGGLRSSADVNENFSDMGDAITGTLPLDAQAGMSGQFKMAQGSAVTPAFGFGSDRNTGIRRRGSDAMAWVAGGVDRMWNSDEGMHFGFAADVAGTLSFSGDFTGSSDLPALEHVADEGNATGIARRTGDNTWDLDQGTTIVRVARDAHGVLVPTGPLADVRIPFAATLTGITMLAFPAGSCVLDIWKDTYANYPPTVADTICGSSKPTLASADDYNDDSLSGWTTTITAGDILRFNVDSIADVTKLVITLRLKRWG